MATEKKKRTKRHQAKQPVFNRVATVKENRAASITVNKSAKRYDFGKGNKLPNELLNAVSSSVTASSCRNKNHEFIEAKGFQDKSIASLIVNPKQTANDLHAEFADTIGCFDAVAACVKYNGLGVPYYLYSLPFECTRKTTDGQYYVNADLENGKDVKGDRVYYQEFNRTESPQSRLARVNQQIKDYGYQTGDIVYIFAKKAGQREYPIPSAWAGMEDIESDAALSRLDWRNVKKGFRPDAILTTIGNIDDETEDENGKTERDHFDKALGEFMGEDAAPIFEMNVGNPDEVPKLETFSQEKVLNSTTEATNRVGKKVCRAMGVPDVLVPGFAVPGQLGNKDEILTLLKMFNVTIGRKQRLSTRVFETVWPQFNWTVEPLSILEDLPQWLIDTMTTNEKRNIGGLPPLETTETE